MTFNQKNCIYNINLPGVKNHKIHQTHLKLNTFTECNFWNKIKQNKKTCCSKWNHDWIYKDYLKSRIHKKIYFRCWKIIVSQNLPSSELVPLWRNQILKSINLKHTVSCAMLCDISFLCKSHSSMLLLPSEIKMFINNLKQFSEIVCCMERASQVTHNFNTLYLGSGMSCEEWRWETDWLYSICSIHLLFCDTFLSNLWL